MTQPHVTRMSPHGRDWLAGLEGGYRLTAYLDSKGIPTISAGLTYYPHSGQRVKLGDTLSLPVAQEFFAEVLRSFEQGVDSQTTDDLLQYEFDALVAFAFNVGLSAYSSSSLARLVNDDAPLPAIEHQFLRWVHAAGEVVPGLVTRRKLEFQVYSSGPYTDQSGRVYSPELV